MGIHAQTRHPSRWFCAGRLLFLLLPAFLFVLAGGRGLSGEVTAQLWQRSTGNQTQLAASLTIPEGYYLYHAEMGNPKAIGLPLRFFLADGTPIESYASSAPHQKEQSLYDGSGKSVTVNVHTDTARFYFNLPQKSGAVTLEIKGQMCSDMQCLPVDIKVQADLAVSSQSQAAFSSFPAASAFVKAPASWRKPPTAGGSISAGTSASAAGNGSIRTGIRGTSILPGLTPPQNGLPVQPDAPAASVVKPASSAAALPEFEIRSAGVSRPVLGWLGMALLAGILLNFMPCVLPVISLKIISFVNQSGESRRRLLGLSLAFAAGMILVFLALATVAISLQMHWGEQFQSEAFNIALAVLVFAFSLSFFGVYEFGVPDAANRLQAGSLPREGYMGAFCTGMLATVLATPCSGPFLGATLSWALAQPPALVMLVFACLGVGMALPYVLLTMSTRLRGLLPKPGAWMLTFRQVMGFLLLLTVVYLMIFIRRENLVPTCALLVCAAFACWLIGKYAVFTRRVVTRWTVRLLAVAVLASSTALFFGPLRPFLSGMAEQGEWLAFDEARFASDLAEGKNVLLDFTADWCPNCKYNEFSVLATPEVRSALKGKQVVCYQIDLTEDTPQTERYRELLRKLGGAAIPYLAIFPADQPQRPFVLPDVLTVSRVLQTLEQLPSPIDKEK